MSKNLTRKGLAFVGSSALVAASIVGFASSATAASGDVTLAPSVGSGTTAFSTDPFTLKTTVKTAVVNPATLAYRIDNPDQYQLKLNFGQNSVAEVTLMGITEAGAKVETSALGSASAIAQTEIVVDFETLDITSLVIYNITTASAAAPAGNNGTVTITLDEAATGTDINGSVSADAYDYGQLASPASISVQSWVETSTTADYRTVDPDYASSKLEVNFIDPSSVSLIPRIERYVGTANNKLQDASPTKVVRARGAADSASTTALDAGSSFGGVTLATGDKILLDDSNASPVDGIYTVNATGAPTAADTTLTGDKILVLEGTDRGKVYNASATSELTGSSASATLLNQGAAQTLGSSLDFSNQALNLAQVVLGNWELSVVSSSTDDVAYGTSTIAQLATPAGETKTDALGRLFFQVPVADLSVNEGETYSLSYRHKDDTVAPILEFSSPGYQVIAAPASHAGVRITASAVSSTDVVIGTYASSAYPVSVRNGLAAVSFKTQVRNSSDAAVEVSNIPVMAIVTAASTQASAATLSVSGATETITGTGTTIVTGLTDSKGNWNLTVTSSDTSSASSGYTVEFHVLTSATPGVWANAATSSNNADYVVDYASGSLASSGFTADATVLSGDNPTVTFSVKDQFGQPLSASASGSAYSVELKAPSKTNLEQFVAVSGGKATFTFKNYVATGASDILTAKLFTGSSTSPSYVSGAVVYITLYNANAVAGVNVPTEITAVTVTYDDFITGTASSSNVAPTDGANTGTGEDFLLSGTVVDANGAGVPGAQVTLAGKGFQFVKDGSSSYFIDTITIAASESGTFAVRGWTTVASSTGNPITVTSAGKTATTLVKSVLYTDGNGADGSTGELSAANLSFSWTVPQVVLMNTTYAIVAKVADKWGNPVKNASVTFSGYGAAQFNGAATATRTTGSDGTVTAYLRSLKDVDGVSAIGVQLTDIDQDADAKSDTDNLGSTLTNSSSTKWDESKWTNTLETQVNFLSTAPASIGEVAIGSFNGRVAVRIEGLQGSKLSVKVGKKWYVLSSVPSNRYVWSVPSRKGTVVAVSAYINGDLENTSTITVK